MPLTNPAGAGGGVTLDEVIDALYPVGSLYTSTLSTNPGTLLGRGTWSAFGAGRVMVGHNSGDADFDTAEETGGAKTVQSAGSISAHSGTAVADHAAHTHSVTSNVAVGDHASHTHTYTDVVNHTHLQQVTTTTTGNFTGVTTAVDTSSGGTNPTPAVTLLGIPTANPTGGVASGTTAGPSATLTHSVTQPSAHTLSGSSEAVSAGTPAGTISTPTFTGDATSVVQPYIVVHIWKRTA